MHGSEGHSQSNGHKPLVAELPSHVIAALDLVSGEERQSVLAAVQAFARDEADGERLDLSEPVYMLHAAPELLVFVRKDPGAPVEVQDIVRPATLRQFAHVRE